MRNQPKSLARAAASTTAGALFLLMSAAPAGAKTWVADGAGPDASDTHTGTHIKEAGDCSYRR